MPMEKYDIEKRISELEAELKTLRTMQKPKPKSTPGPEIRAAARTLVPMDDVMFTKMAEDAATCEEVISTILGVRVRVLDVISQSTIANLQGRGVRLDALADIAPAMRVQVEYLEGSALGPKGAKANIEVQRSDNDDHQRRVRYNASAITMNFTPPGARFEDIPDVVEIFISAFDVFRKGQMRYDVDRVLRGSGTAVFNGVTEIYINASAKDRSTGELSDISDLMELFTEREAYDYDKFPSFSKRKHQFSCTEEGVNELSDILEQLMEKRVEEGRQEGLERGQLSAIRNIMANANCSSDRAMELIGIPKDERGKYAEMLRAE